MARPALKKFTAITILILALALTCATGQEYNFRHLTVDDGLPTNNCWSVLKDSKGFIWITTSAGLCRYDGYNLKVFQYDPFDSSSLSDNGIYSRYSMIEGQDGNLWIGTINGLNRFDPITGKFTRYRHSSLQTETIGSNNILCLLKDQNNVIWAGNGASGGLNRYDALKDSFETYYPVSGDSSHHVVSIHSLLEDRKGRLWVGTRSGLFLFDRNTKDFSLITLDTQNINIAYQPWCKTIHEDIDGTIYVSTPQGFLVFDSTSQQVTPYNPLYFANLDIRHSDLLTYTEDEEFTHLVITIVGLYRFNKFTHVLKRIKPDPFNPFSISGNALKSIYRDEYGMLWIPCEFGVNILDPRRNGIQNYPVTPGEYLDATCFLEDSKGHFWKGSKYLEQYDENMNLIKRYPFIILNRGKVNFSGAVFGLLEDKEKNLWVGNDYNGLYLLKAGSSTLVPCTFSNPGVTYIWDIFEDSSGNLWIGTSVGLFYRKRDDKPFNYFYRKPSWDLLNKTEIFDILEDYSGNLWVGTGNGLFYQTSEKKGTDVFLKLPHNSNDPYSISNNRIWAFHEDKSGNLWVATEYGLNRRIDNKNNFDRYFCETDPGNNFIYDITSDDKGILWLTTANGLIRFDPELKTDSLHGKNNFKQILPVSDIFPYRIYKNRKGVIFVGGAYNSGKGYFCFHPDSLKENKRVPPIAIIDFRTRDKSLMTDTCITFKKYISLTYKQNFFSFEYAALDYTNPPENQYAYQLEGLDQDWIYAGNLRYANYTKVPPGHYVFRVKGSNNDGYWNETGTSLAITIHPPPWKTWWSFILYGLVILATGYLIIRSYLNRLQLSHRLELEHLEARKLKELDSMKSHFFANISHEFRTPLTLILGPLNDMLAMAKDQAAILDLQIMQRSAQRLQRLINQLLDLSRIESGKNQLNIIEANISELVKNYVQQFESLARQKQIELLFNAEREIMPVFIDQEKIEGILYNLLSNSFKFTPEGGRVTVTVEITPLSHLLRGEFSTIKSLLPSGGSRMWVSICVADTGSGISPEHLPRIFDRFFQAGNSYIKDGEGTGIGLALTKELVELHHGFISVESELSKGSAFHVYLPMGKEHLKEKEKLMSQQLEVSNQQSAVSSQHPVEVYQTPDLDAVSRNLKPETDKYVPLILIIEDNPDLRLYILGHLQQEYRLIEADDGEQGLERAIEHVPDLILTDVMMPKMDGFELSRRLKSDERTSHIPIILLTARAGMESRIEGLETGADDFITKPFDHQELLVRIKNLIALRKKLSQHFIKSAMKIGFIELIQFSKNSITSSDERFMQKAVEVVEKHISDETFSAETFRRELAMSRMQLHRKLKAITGLSASGFIRLLRLKRASELLAKKSGNVSQIAFEVGFSSLSYFTKTFKEQFGVLPSEYKARDTK